MILKIDQDDQNYQKSFNNFIKIRNNQLFSKVFRPEIDLFSERRKYKKLPILQKKQRPKI